MPTAPAAALAGPAALVCASLVADALLARRFAGGDERADRATCRWLVTSLTSNMLFGFACFWLPVGRFAEAAPWAAPVGLALGGLGLLVRYGAIGQLGRRFTWRVTILADHALATDGLYRWVRHPSYLGGLVAATGILLALGNAVPLVVFACSHVPLVVHRVRVEEPVLAAHFGEAWRAYAGRTWALLPGIW